jgi:hypothetical protein
MTSPTIVNFTINKVAGSDEGGIYIKDDSTAPTFINGHVTTVGEDAAIHTKVAFDTTQENTIAFKDVTLDSTTKYDGLGATSAQTRHEANDAVVNSIVYPTRTQAQIDAATVLSGDITANTTLVAGTLYKIDGLVKVKNNAVLTIEPGTVIFGDTTGDDYIVVTKGSQIIADGTATSPIVFTSEIALLNPANSDVAQWGGLTVLGDATTNHTTPFYEVDQTDADFAFGGTTDNDDSGILRNVYVLNSGKVIGTDVEINGLSLAGVGSGTVVENIYVQNSADDCIEIWGGTVNVTNATMVNCQDDGFDLDYGYTGTATNIVVQQTEAFHAGFEISSGGTTPMTSPTIVNFTINKVAGSDEGGIYIKDDSTAPTFINGHVTTVGEDAAIHTKVAFDTTQENTIAFKDVSLTNKEN